MEKVIRDGKVAIIYSPGYGAGWYTWNSDHEELLYHPKIVETIEAGKRNEINEDWCNEFLGLSDIYCGGAKNLNIEWLPQGTPFIVQEYDGSESIETMESLTKIA